MSYRLNLMIQDPTISTILRGHYKTKFKNKCLWNFIEMNNIHGQDLDLGNIKIALFFTSIELSLKK